MLAVNGDGFTLHRSVQVLLDLGLPDDVIASYLVRFNVQCVENLMQERLLPGCEHSLRPDRI